MSVYQQLPGLVLGFHGTDQLVGETILGKANTHVRASNNLWDWLGSGIYFWENDPQRALEFAQFKMTLKTNDSSKHRIKNAFVLGAVIDLGLCCNLLDRAALDEVKASYDKLLLVYDKAKLKLPKNTGKDHALRYLDRAVMQHLHILRSVAGLPAYDTLRGLFWEGDFLYANSGAKDRNHVQIAVRKRSQIKAYFHPFTA